MNNSRIGRTLSYNNGNWMWSYGDLPQENPEDECPTSPSKQHEWVNISLMSVKEVCKYCDLDRSKHHQKTAN